MEQKIENAEAPEAADLSSKQREQFVNARDQFLADHVRFEDVPSNWDVLIDWLDQFSPPLPMSAKALAYAYEQTEDQLELMEPPDESDPEIQEALADHQAKQMERVEEIEEKPKSEPATVSQAAKEAGNIFRRRQRGGEFSHHRNGKCIDGGFGS